MEDKPLEMPFLKNIGLLMTYKCQVACPHCIIEAGPDRTEEMPCSDLLDWIRQIADYRDGYIKVLSLTGGEPFFNIEVLKSVSEYGAAQGLFVSVVTNAYWATTEREAVRLLGDLPAIRMISISTDMYHQKFIPFARVRNAIAAAETHNIPYTIAVCTENETDRAYQGIIKKLKQVTDEGRILTAVTFRAGRALHKTGSNYETLATPPKSACAAGSSPIIFPDGRITACIGPIIDLTSDHPLVLGDLRKESLATILDCAELNPILHAIRIWGPRRLISLAEDAGLGKELPTEYIKDSTCHACYDLMANDRLRQFYADLKDDEEFVRKVAYGRAYYLCETAMIQSVHDRE
ncbi:MAG: radical SAM protein [Chloroflexi bacterium]|nr:radical SAM protein [Chloroflexota bacterium]